MGTSESQGTQASAVGGADGKSLTISRNHGGVRSSRKGQTAPASVESNSEETKLRVLVAEDDPADVELLLQALRSGGFEPDGDIVQTEREFVEQVRKNPYDVVLTDYNLPSWNGMGTVEVLRREDRDIPVVLVSGSLGELKAVECIKQGAADYVLKDHLPRLSESVRRALRDQKLRAEHRQSLEDLARSNRDLEQFAYVASHDLQEPLRMVATYTQLLAERYQGKLDENAGKYIHYALEGALRMQTLVQDLLAFSRVGRQEVVFRTVECKTVVDVALTNLQAAIRESGAEITCEPLPALVADGSQLAQVFQNLIGNAIKFHGQAIPVIRVSAEKQRREWIFSVADNGIGIAPEHAELVFAIFKRLHTRAEYPGSGIGLAICQKIIERHGGRIWLESELGQGSTFKFALPARGARGEYDSIAENRG